MSNIPILIFTLILGLFKEEIHFQEIFQSVLVFGVEKDFWSRTLPAYILLPIRSFFLSISLAFHFQINISPFFGFHLTLLIEPAQVFGFGVSPIT